MTSKWGNIPQCTKSIHYTENCLQLKNDPLVYLKNTPQMEPRIIKPVNKLNNAPLELISSKHTLLGISNQWKKPRLKESAPLGAHLNRMKVEYVLVWISDVDKRMNPISSLNCLQTQKSIKHQYVKQEIDQMLPKVSSIKENMVTTILQPVYKSLSK